MMACGTEDNKAIKQEKKIEELLNKTEKIIKLLIRFIESVNT